MQNSDSHHSCAIARPGDTLIIGLATPTTLGTTKRIADGLKAGLPDDVKVCVVDNVSAIQVVRGGEN